jgi:hypothetical protein
VGLKPSHCAEAPLISWGESWETVFGGGLGQIVPSLLGKFKELLSDLRANQMLAIVVGSCLAEAVPIEAGHWRVAAYLESSPKYIFLFHHKTIVLFIKMIEI